MDINMNHLLKNDIRYYASSINNSNNDWNYDTNDDYDDYRVTLRILFVRGQSLLRRQ